MDTKVTYQLEHGANTGHRSLRWRAVEVEGAVDHDDPDRLREAAGPGDRIVKITTTREVVQQVEE